LHAVLKASQSIIQLASSAVLSCPAASSVCYAALDSELEALRQEATSLVAELEEHLAASATSQRLQDDLDRLDAGP
jgi:hypothetical protein